MKNSRSEFEIGVKKGEVQGWVGIQNSIKSLISEVILQMHKILKNCPNFKNFKVSAPGQPVPLCVALSWINLCTEELLWGLAGRSAEAIANK